MNIGIDIRPALEEPAGIGKLVFNLTRSLASLDSMNSYVLYSRTPLTFSVANPRFRTVTRNFGNSVPGRLAWQLYMIYHARRVARLDLLVSAAALAPAVLTRDFVFLIVADLTNVLLASHHAWRTKLSGAYLLRRALSRARHIVAISRNTRSDILKFAHGGIPEAKVTVAYISCEDRFKRKQTDLGPVVRKYGLQNPFVLSVGTIEPRKNYVRLIRAFERIAGERSGLDLVIAGRKGWRWGDVIRAAEESRFAPRIRILEFVPTDDLPSLYAGAAVFAYPSLYEGFGIPPLEAMAIGVPVVCSKSSSLPEVVGEAALCVDPMSVDEICSGILRLLDDATFRKTMVRAGQARAAMFSWDSFAREILQSFEASR